MRDISSAGIPGMRAYYRRDSDKDPCISCARIVLPGKGRTFEDRIRTWRENPAMHNRTRTDLAHNIPSFSTAYCPSGHFERIRN